MKTILLTVFALPGLLSALSAEENLQLSSPTPARILGDLPDGTPPPPEPPQPKFTVPPANILASKTLQQGGVAKSPFNNHPHRATLAGDRPAD